MSVQQQEISNTENHVFSRRREPLQFGRIDVLSSRVQEEMSADAEMDASTRAPLRQWLHQRQIERAITMGHTQEDGHDRDPLRSLLQAACPLHDEASKEFDGQNEAKHQARIAKSRARSTYLWPSASRYLREWFYSHPGACEHGCMHLHLHRWDVHGCHNLPVQRSPIRATKPRSSSRV